MTLHRQITSVLDRFYADFVNRDDRDLCRIFFMQAGIDVNDIALTANYLNMRKQMEPFLKVM